MCEKNQKKTSFSLSFTHHLCGDEVPRPCRAVGGQSWDLPGEGTGRRCPVGLGFSSGQTLGIPCVHTYEILTSFISSRWRDTARKKKKKKRDTPGAWIAEGTPYRRSRGSPTKSKQRQLARLHRRFRPMWGIPMLAHGGMPVLVELLNIVHCMSCELAHAVISCSRVDTQVVLHGSQEGSR